jgi:hypothetical protein
VIGFLKDAGIPPWLLLLGAGVLAGCGGALWLRAQADAADAARAQAAQAESKAAVATEQAALNSEVTRVLERTVTRETRIERIVEDASADIEAATGGDRLISEDVERALRAGVERLRVEAAGGAGAGADAGDPGSPAPAGAGGAPSGPPPH